MPDTEVIGKVGEKLGSLLVIPDDSLVFHGKTNLSYSSFSILDLAYKVVDVGVEFYKKFIRGNERRFVKHFLHINKNDMYDLKWMDSLVNLNLKKLPFRKESDKLEI